MSQDPFNPYLPPEADVSGLPLADGPDRIPWEDPSRFPAFWSRVGQMFKLAFTDVFHLFDLIPTSEDLAKPMGFLLLFCLPAMALQVVFGLVMTLLMPDMPQAHAGPGPLPFSPRYMLGATMGFQVLLLPLFTLASAFLVGLLMHVTLWAFGGLKEGLSLTQTLRANLYAYAFSTLFNVVPLLNLLVLLAVLVFTGIGLARIHRTDTWRGVMAGLSPIALCCCCIVLFVVAMAGVVGGFGR